MQAQPHVLQLTDASKPVAAGKYLTVWVDPKANTPLNNIPAQAFQKHAKDIPIYPVPEGVVWARLSLVNHSADSVLFLDLQYPNITQLQFYRQQPKGTLALIWQGGNGKQPYHINQTEEKEINPFYILRDQVARGDTATYYLRIESKHQVLLPLFVENRYALDKSMQLQNLVIGVYAGIIMAILLYNLFLFFATRDKSYLIYVSYLFFLGLAQITVSGYAYKYLWPSFPGVNDVALPVSSALAGITGIAFAGFFLRTRLFAPRLNPWLGFLILVFFVSLSLSIAGYNNTSYTILNMASMAGGITLIAASVYIGVRHRYKPAFFYLVAWIAFLGGMVIFVLRNVAIMPYNNFSTYILYVGSAIEAILLSIALADKINILRRQKEVSQAKALEASIENERLVKEQNIMLEQKVAERTVELQDANTRISNTLTELKNAQTQLVEAEKMASLGQLTAGIAHEINNPINFVKSNIKPLQLDIQDMLEVIASYEKLHTATAEEREKLLKEVQQFKQEIDMEYVKTELLSLIKGIEDGAERTAEIVRGLRTFSRLDESEMKEVNIHEGIESTLVLLKNNIPHHVKVTTDFKAEGEVECFPGKLNQAFMNILSNALQAIKGKPQQQEEEYITISTEDVDNTIRIHIKDSGPGMDDSVKQKIFDPFFTTKDVGEGTGLGLSIVFNIIQKHHGKIEVNSSPGHGAEFVLTLFHTLPA
jgi:hypothetical protein